ncbi:MAG: hypothetical protein IKR94_01385 [Bacteroidales bacterium]|nr:hypothetical protein [Bacteroidales bacterium]
MLKHLIYGTLLSVAVLFASCSGNQNNNSGNNQASSNQTATPVKGTPEDIWRAYLKSNLTDFPKQVTDLDRAMKKLKKIGQNATKLVIDNETGTTYDMESSEDNAEIMGDSESNDSALGFFYETMAIFDNNDGSQTILLHSERPGDGRKMVCLLSYKNGSLTRLKNQLPFQQHSLLEHPEFGNDKVLNLRGTEVEYLDYDVTIDWDNINAKSIQMLCDDEPTDNHKWNGEKFQ